MPRKGEPSGGQPPGAPGDPVLYEAWYRRPRGRWMADRELELLLELMDPAPGTRVLDVGCGTGHFTRALAAAGLEAVGLDLDLPSLALARCLDPGGTYVAGDARALPFPERSFDHAVAVTSLCFVDHPWEVLAEMRRVSRGRVVLGLLHRRSLLRLRKAGRGGYRGARWDRPRDVLAWLRRAVPEGRPLPQVRLASALLLPGGGPLARRLETSQTGRRLAREGLWGGFLAVAVEPGTGEDR